MGDWKYTVVQCTCCKSSVRVAEAPFDGNPVERYEAALRKAAEIWNGAGDMADEVCGTCRFFVSDEDYNSVCDKSGHYVSEDTESCPRYTKEGE